MIKEARKPSMDPAQEKLRQSKAAWNKEVSAFINDVIHAKKLMNGWPSKYFKEKSKIIFPIPGNASSILNTLASQFQDLSQQGAAIAQQQADYAKNRRVKRPEQANQTLNKLDEKYGPTESTVPAPLAPTTTPSSTDLTKQLASSFEEKYALIAEGSNPFSRFMARLKTPQIGFGAAAQKRRLRMDMLKAAIKSYRALGKMQVYITKSSKESVVDAYKSMQLAWNEWSIVSRNFNTIVNNMPDQISRPEDMKDELPPGTEPDLEVGKNKIVPLLQPEKPILTKVEPTAPIIAPLNLTPPETEQKELDKKKKEQPAATLDQLEVVAQAFLQKWLGKTRHQVIPGKSSGLRIQAYEVADRCRKSIDAVMDLLEKGFVVEQLGPKISEVSGYINNLRSLMRSLHSVEKPTKGQDSSLFGGTL